MKPSLLSFDFMAMMMGASINTAVEGTHGIVEN
jgi:hypothetical protein